MYPPPKRPNFLGPTILLAISAVTGPGLVAWWYLDVVPSAGREVAVVFILMGLRLVLVWTVGALCAYGAFKAFGRMRRRRFDSGHIMQALALLFLACNLLPGAAFLLVLLG